MLTVEDRAYAFSDDLKYVLKELGLPYGVYTTYAGAGYCTQIKSNPMGVSSIVAVFYDGGIFKDSTVESSLIVYLNKFHQAQKTVNRTYGSAILGAIRRGP